MLRLIGLFAQATLILLIVYNSVTALWGWPERPSAPVGSRSRRFRVVVPAHNEALVIGVVLADLRASEYPADLMDIWVVDDRSTDTTAKVGRDLGVSVAARAEGPSGKGHALGWYLATHPLHPDQVLVVFDADNRVPPDVLGRIADEIDNGHSVVQCYLDVTEPGGSWLAEASALSYWAGNRMVQLARSNLGWSSDLGGTGMAMTPRALDDSGGFVPSLTEDQDLGVRLLIAGHRVEWLHDVRIQDEKPNSIGVAVRQRARWMSGKRATRRHHLGTLLRLRSAAAADMAIRLIQPGRSFVALVSGILTVMAFTTSWTWLLPWQWWALLTLLQLLLPIPFLIRDQVEPRHILRYPLLALLAALWIPVRLVSSRVQGWYHTPHRGTTADDEAGPDL